MRSPLPLDDDSQQLASATHLVVFQHGLLGSKHDFGRFVEIFRSQFHVDGLYLHSGESNGNSFFQTYDGVDQGGERLADEIQRLAQKMPRLRKLSMIGHSLGGLYNRYCIGVLLSRGFFDKIEPVNFVTLATPHLGIRRSHRHATNVVFNAVMTKIFSRTGQQLTLTDSANEMTQKLSAASNVSLDKEFHAAFLKIEDTLLVSLRQSELQKDGSDTPFELYSCVLSDRKLQIFEQIEEAANDKVKVEIDLTHADVKVLLPPLTQENVGGLYASFIGGSHQNSDDEDTEAFGNFDIQIRWPIDMPSPLQTGKTADTSLCVLRIPEEDIHRDWRWLAALSNASFGVHCLTPAENGRAQQSQSLTAPTLLSCMARGQFMQALQMFKVRTLYANMFFDMQVPYSCASIRAYNPYRQDMKENLMSPIYTHIVLDSLKNARKLRDTLPLRIKRLALRYIKPNHLALLNVEDALHRASEDESIEANSVTTSNSINGRRHSSEPQEKKSASRGRSEHSGLFHSRRRGKSVSNAPSASHRRGDKPRPVPFVDGDVVLDQLPYAFTSDAQQDELRGMLLSVQSVGWRRIDVLFGSVMAHEHIIAKRAKVEKPLDSGIDIVHHVMDTFVL